MGILQAHSRTGVVTAETTGRNWSRAPRSCSFERIQIVAISGYPMQEIAAAVFSSCYLQDAIYRGADAAPFGRATRLISPRLDPGYDCFQSNKNRPSGGVPCSTVVASPRFLPAQSRRRAPPGAKP